MTAKEFFSKAKEIIFSFFTFIGLIFTGALALLLLFKNRNKTPVNTLNTEDIKDEIQNTNSSDIIAESPNQSAISSTIEQQQQQLRERIRNRFKQNVHRK